MNEDLGASQQPFTKAELIEKISRIIDRGWIEDPRPTNQGSHGNLLEDLLGLKENNLPIPNAAEWELKSIIWPARSLMTLLHCEPSPTALKFVPTLLLPHFGWTHKQAGLRYSANEMSFRQTIRGGTYTPRGFGFIANEENQRFEIVFDPSKTSASFQSWLAEIGHREGKGLLVTNPYWGFEDLSHKIGAKLRNTFLVYAETKKTKNAKKTRFRQLVMLKGISADSVVNAVRNGFLYVDFDARTGHNHGTKFRIRVGDLEQLYDERTVIYESTDD